MAELGRRFDAPRNGRRAALLIAFGLAASAIAGLAPVVGDVAPAHAASVVDVMAWAPYWASTDALTSFKAQPDTFSELTPFFFTATSATAVGFNTSMGKQQSTLDTYKAVATTNGKRLIATVVDGTGTRVMAGILADPDSRTAHVQALVNFMTANGFDGLDIDYEQFAFADGRSSWPDGPAGAGTFTNWGSFVTELATAIHAIPGKTLAVSVPPIYNSGHDSTSGYWVYNYPVMASVVDRIRVMTYSYSVSSPGPLAPYSWVSNTMDATLKIVPASKLVMGIPAYGTDWVTSIDGSCPADALKASSTATRKRSVTTASAPQIAADKGQIPKWDAARHEMTFKYVESFGGPDSNGIPVRCNVSRTVWYVDAQGVYDRTMLAQSKGVVGVAIWALGYDNAAMWQGIAAARAGVGFAAPAPIAPSIKPPAVSSAPSPIDSSGPLPARYVETRTGYKTADGLVQGGGKRPADSTLEVQIGGRGPVPGDASAVTLNVTVIGDTPGFVTVYPCGTRPTTSSLNVKPGQAISNTVIAKLSASGSVCIYTQVAVDLVVDVFSVLPDSAIQTLGTPARLLDTRAGEPTSDGLGSGAGAVTGGTFVQVPVAGRGGIRNAAESAILNVTAVGAVGAGFLTVWPCDSPRPTTSNVNFVKGDAIPNAVITGLSSVGSVCVFASVTTNVVIDVSGELDPDAYQPLDQPARLLDTRAGQTTIDGQFNNVGKRSLNQTTEIAVGGRGGLPSAPSAVVLNVTVDRPELAGFITVYPCGTARPPVSNVNFSPNQTLPNLVVTMLSSTSTVCVYSLVPTDIVIDVFGTLTL